MRVSLTFVATAAALVWTTAASASPFDAGARVGVSYQFGTQGNRLGATVDGFSRLNPTDTELRLTLSLYRTFTHVETRRSGRERQLILGLTQGFGTESQGQITRGRDWTLAANNTERRHSIGVYSILYRDTYETSQRVRGIALSLGRVGVRFENDFDPAVLLGDYGDRFRSSAVEITYRASDHLRYVAGFNLFTGDPEEGVMRPRGPDTAGRHGDYAMQREDGTPVTAADRSIANAWLGVRGLDLADGGTVGDLLGLNDLQARVGWSSEGIRQVVQNRFHDLIDNPHIPLREEARARPYLTFGTNHGQTLYP